MDIDKQSSVGDVWPSDVACIYDLSSDSDSDAERVPQSKEELLSESQPTVQPTLESNAEKGDGASKLEVDSVLEELVWLGRFLNQRWH